MNVCIIGTGYVGMVTGVCLAAKGHEVSCVDVRPEVVRKLNAGVPHIHEDGLKPLLAEGLQTGRLRATDSLPQALGRAQLVMIAVGTPSVDGRMDLASIRQAASQVGTLLPRLDRFLSVVVKSTVLPGTTDTVVRQTLEQHSRMTLGDFGLGMNPEFLREGRAVQDFMEPDRIVFGHEDPQTLSLLEELYAPWDCDKVRVNSRTAEMAKYVSNCLLATQISTVNELANLAAALGAVDIMQVMEVIHLDRRWNPILPGVGRVRPDILTYLVPGCGFGGSCFPKDVQALRTQGREFGLRMTLLQSVLDINEAQPLQVAAILKQHFESLRDLHILVLGLAFKPGTDDVRESPARPIIAGLLNEGARISSHDPVAATAAGKAWPELPLGIVCEWEAALAAADAVCIVTPWPEYRRLRAPENLACLRGKCLFDARRMLQPSEFEGVTYLTIGRKA
jgi:UDPglucose 6-dehydrogenase/GDP-mannose 6-dehydrogenase